MLLVRLAVCVWRRVTWKEPKGPKVRYGQTAACDWLRSAWGRMGNGHGREEGSVFGFDPKECCREARQTFRRERLGGGGGGEPAAWCGRLMVSRMGCGFEGTGFFFFF
ncbi:unnamed protein product [Ectocarpus sp. 13 AM-2016]